jgi:guanylate kinase
MGATERGILVIISSPSGAGKTTLSRKLLAEFPSLEFSVSYTTRTPRKNEENGKDYFFVEESEFDAMVARGEFAEHAEVHGNRYGTARSTVERALVEGRDVVFDVDWQGGRDLSAAWPEDSLKIFILPPDLETLEGRLRRRATDAEEVIVRRLRVALAEMEHHRDYEYVIVNDVLDEAYEVLRAVYLVRRFGSSDRSDVAHSLTALAEVVRRHQESGSRQRAEVLVAAGKSGQA